MNNKQELYVRSDNIIQLANLQDAVASTYVNDATVTASIFESMPHNLDSAAAVDAGGGSVDIPLTAHSFSVGETVRLVNTRNYDGQYTITAIDTNDFTISATYVAETFEDDAVVYRGVPNALDITLAYDGNSTGTYNGIVPRTAVLLESSWYSIFATAVSGSYQLVERLNCRAIFSES
jgi:hypothetical protein